VSREEQRHISYLLRLWPVRSEDGIVWRASLESAHTGDRIGFASLDALFAFLRGRTDAEPGAVAPEE
jgi:hypothetical protein